VLALLKNTGYLITVVFPIDGPRQDGPPYSVHVGMYEELLGEKLEKIVDKVPEKSSPSHEGVERIVIWKWK
jgi:methyl halide transferase